MTIQEIKNKAKENGQFSANNINYELEINIPFFEKEVKIHIYNIPNSDNENAWQLTEQIIGNLLSLGEQDKVWLKEKMWAHYQLCIDQIDYGMVDYGHDDSHESHIQSNRNYFKIYNPEDAYNNATLDSISFELDFNSNYSLLYYDCPWEDEHGMIVQIKEGKFHSLE